MIFYLILAIIALTIVLMALPTLIVRAQERAKKQAQLQPTQTTTTTPLK